ncbi:MAG: MCE family protein [Desulfamplus sp.]|nr:MCE family protein [Desulfamplus sp.]
MGSKPNNILIGSFVVGAITLVIVAIMVFGSGYLFKDKNLFILHFKGSVKGLSVGSPVVLRGVKIGSVQDIRINAISNSRDFSIPVIIEIGQYLVVMSDDSSLGYDASGNSGLNRVGAENINSDYQNQKATIDNLSVEENLKSLIDRGLRAQLEMQSMVTGQLLVGLDFHPEKPARLSGQKSKYPEIPTIQTDIEEFTQKIKQVPIEEMFNKLFSIISSVEKSFNPESIGQLLTSLSLTLKSLNKISDSLDEHLPAIASDVEDTIKNANILMQNSNSQLIALSGLLKQAIADTQNLISIATLQIETTGATINDTVSNTNTLVTNINNQVPPVSKSLKETIIAAKSTLNTAKESLTSAKLASDQAQVMFKNVDKITGRDSVLITNLNSTLNDLSDAARSLRLLAEYLERHPESLIQGKR